MPRRDVEIRVGGQVFTAWEGVTVTRDVTSCSGGAILEVGSAAPSPFRPGAPLDVRFGPHRLLTGFVDRVELAPGGRKMVGRDASADLVDCCPDPDGPFASSSTTDAPAAGRRQWKWTNATLDQITSDLAFPFGLVVNVTGDVGGPFARFAVEPGERVFRAIDRALRQRGLLFFTPGDGTILLKSPERARAAIALEEGRNLEDWKIVDSHEDRFSTYRVLSQRPTSALDAGSAPGDSSGRADDPDIDRLRPFVMIAESASDFLDATLRAGWERSVRAARSRFVLAFVRDWCKSRAADGSPGELWRPDEVLRLKIGRYSVDSDWYVQSVTYRRIKKQGLRAELRLVPVDSFDPEPAAAPAPVDVLAGAYSSGAEVSAEPDFPETDE